MMKPLYALPVLYVFLIKIVVCQYQRDCTNQNDNGQRYIPSERNMTINAEVVNGDPIHVYRVPNLRNSCRYGRVTAIEYCYRYTATTAWVGQFTFNWTLLMLQEVGSNFVINNIHVLESNGSRGSAKCVDSRSGNGLIDCCDVTNVSFDLPTDFIFGATESAQGNTHDAALLAFNDIITISDKWELNKDGITLSEGSTLPIQQTLVRGILMLWFVVAETEAPGTEVTSKEGIETTTAVVTPVTPSNLVTLIGAVVGGVAGSLLVLVLLLVLALVWMRRKNKRSVNKAKENQQQQQWAQLEGNDLVDTVRVQLQQQGDESIKVKSNYTFARQIPTVDNVAYGQIQSDYNLLSNQSEYEYV